MSAATRKRTEPSRKLSTAEAAHLRATTVGFLSVERAKGKGPAFYVAPNRRVFYDESDVLEFIAKKKELRRVEPKNDERARRRS